MMILQETELEQLRRFNNEKAAALDKAHKRIKELEEIIYRLERPHACGKRGEEIMREVMAGRVSRIHL